MDEKDFEATREAYRAWLSNQWANDMHDRELELPRIERSREEQMAIYLNAPKQQRKKIARFYKI